MTGKRILTVVIALLVIGGLGGGGYFVYAKMTSPEAKLANAFEAFQQEDKFQVDSDVSMEISFDEASEEMFDTTEENQVYVDVLMDVLQNIEGEVSTIYDRDQKVVESDALLGIAGDIRGEEVDLKFPLRMYVDEKAEEVAMDLDVYPEFLQDLIDVLMNHVYLNTPEGKELARVMEEEGMDGERFVEEIKGTIVPVVEEAIQGAKYVTDFEEAELELDDGKTYFGNNHVWGTFVGKEVMQYLQEKTEGEYISSKDEWIHLDVENEMLVRAYVHALKEMKEDKEAKAHFEEDMDITLDEAIENMEDFLSESVDDVKLNHKMAFKLSDGKIVETTYDTSFSSEKDGHKTTGTVSVKSVYTYGDAVKLNFHNEERKALNHSDLESTFDQVDDKIAEQTEAVFTEMMKEQLEASAAEIEAAFKENMTDEEYEAFLAALEAYEVKSKDLDMTEDEMYAFVLELEYAGLVKEGTAELYMTESM